MKEQSNRKQIQADWAAKHVLSREDRQKLIQEKIERARLYHEAWRKRETALQQSYR